MLPSYTATFHSRCTSQGFIMDRSTFPNPPHGLSKAGIKTHRSPTKLPWAQIFFAIHGHGGGCWNKQDYVLKYSQGVTPLSQVFCECLALILCGAGTPPNPYSCWRSLGFYANDNFGFTTRYFCVVAAAEQWSHVNLCCAREPRVNSATT